MEGEEDGEEEKEEEEGKGERRVGVGRLVGGGKPRPAPPTP